MSSVCWPMFFEPASSPALGWSLSYINLLTCAGGNFSSNKGVYKYKALSLMPLSFLFSLFLQAAFLTLFGLEMGKKNKKTRVSEDNEEEKSENQENLGNSMAEGKSLYEVSHLSLSPLSIPHTHTHSLFLPIYGLMFGLQSGLDIWHICCICQPKHQALQLIVHRILVVLFTAFLKILQRVTL